MAIATSPAVMAHVTTETGVVTMIIMVLVAGYLLTRRAADFDKAEPKSPRGDHRSAHRCTNGRYGGHPLDQLPGDPFAYLEHRDGYSNKPEFWPRRSYPLLSSMPTPLLSASCSQPLVKTPECLLIPCSGR